MPRLRGSACETPLPAMVKLGKLTDSGTGPPVEQSVRSPSAASSLLHLLTVCRTDASGGKQCKSDLPVSPDDFYSAPPHFFSRG